MKKNQPGNKPKQKPLSVKKEVRPLKNPVKKDPAVYYAAVTIIIACFIFYGNTLSLKYAYDDLMVITGNQFTKQGFHGIGDILTTDLFTGYFGKDQNMVSGGRYRPLALVSFAVEHQFFGENPMISHLVNVLLFSLVCLMLLALNRKLAVSVGFRQEKNPWFYAAPLLVCLLFAAHPVHTEVVANIKSRDEILAFLFCLVSLWFALKFTEERKVSQLLSGGASFFLALLSKENAATFLVIQPVTLWFFTRTKTRDNLVALAPPVIATILFLLIRQAVVGHFTTPLANDLMNNPFVEMTGPQKYATILYTLGLYIKLLIFPHPLTSDYYPYHIPIINPGDWRAILPLVIYMAMIVFILLKIHQKGLVSYCFIFFLVTLSVASNIIFPIGAFMNERFLFFPSLAFCILLVAGIISLANRIPASPGTRKLLIAAPMIVVLLLYAYKTIGRNADWYDSYTLFTTDVKVSANSAKGNEVAGEYIMQKAGTIKDKAVKDSMLRLSIAYQRKAVSIYPKQIIALINLAAAHYEYDKNYDTILIVYKRILGYLPDNPQIYTFFNSLMGKYDNTDHKIRLYTDLLQVNPGRFDVNLNLGSLYLSGKNDALHALPYLEKAAMLNPGDFDAQNLLGTAFGYLGKWNDAGHHFELAETIKPGDPQLEGNLAVVYQNLGEREKAAAMRARALKAGK